MLWPFSRRTATGERSPLVSNPASRPKRRPARTPLPYKQLIVLCVMRLTEPISYTLIFPFINKMLEDIHVSPDPKQIGYYAGVIESVFAVAQLCTAIFWGRLSDHVGRKPVMLTGLFGMAISMIAFGLQKTYTGLLISRFVAGMMNGNIAILQSIVAEITDPTNFAEAAALLPLCFAIGSIIGPIIGGFLALPAQNFPSTFGHFAFLIEYPYFLPCFIGGMLNFGAIVLGVFLLEETLVSKRKPRADDVQIRPDPENYQTLVSNVNPQLAVATFSPPSIRSLCTRPILTVLFTFMTMHLQNVAWNAVIPLYAYTDVQNGGLGLNLQQIGFILSVNGISFIFIQLFAFSPLERRFGAVTLYRWTVPSFTITFLCLPLVAALARMKGTRQSDPIWYMILVMAIRSPGVMCYVCSILLIKMLSPGPAAFGTLNGMMQTCRALAQALGPILGSSLFAISISSGALGGNLAWIVLALVSLLTQVCSLRIPPEITRPKGVSAAIETDEDP